MNITPDNKDIEGRRPLKVRQAGLARGCAAWLSGKNITPNQISVASVGFAALAACSIALLPSLSNIKEYGTVGYRPDTASLLLPIMAAFFIQCRLLCNLFDGMVAVEGGKSTPAGELYNDIPDRIADPLILISAGYAVTIFSWGHSVGWCAGLLAVMTAYIRTLGASIGSPVNFQGPMAKQHRMAVMTVACVLTAFEGYFWAPGYSLLLALGIIVVGCVITIIRRSRHAYLFLENQQNSADR